MIKQTIGELLEDKVVLDRYLSTKPPYSVSSPRIYYSRQTSIPVVPDSSSRWNNANASAGAIQVFPGSEVHDPHGFSRRWRSRYSLGCFSRSSIPVETRRVESLRILVSEKHKLAKRQHVPDALSRRTRPAGGGTKKGGLSHLSRSAVGRRVLSSFPREDQDHR